MSKPRIAARRKYPVVPAHPEPDLLKAAVFSIVATSSRDVTRAGLAGHIGLADASPEQIGAALEALKQDGWISEHYRSHAVREESGKLSIVSWTIYELGPKGAAHV